MMRSWRFLAVVGVLGLAGGLVRGTTVPAFSPVQAIVLPQGSETVDVVLQGNRRACAVVIGSGPPNEEVPVAQHSLLGIYVYDPHGNCVARWDVVDPRVRDGLA